MTTGGRGDRPALTIVVHLGDQRRSRTDSHGIINFSVGLVRQLPAVLEDDERLVVVVNDELVAELGDPWGHAIDRLHVVDRPDSIGQRLRMDHRTLPRIAAAAAADVVLFPKGFLPVAPRPLAGRSTVVVLHDAIPYRMLHERTLPAIRRIRAGYFSLLLSRSMRRADARAFVSSFSADELRAGSPARPLDTIIGEGISLPRQTYRPIGDREPQAVVHSSAHPHKRIDHGIRLLAAARPHALRRIVVIGDGPVPPVEGVEVERVRRPVSVDALASLLADSRLLVFPSSYEGFGLPPIEALAMGTPVVYRRTGAALEVLGDVPGGYDDETPDDFSHALTEALDLDDHALTTLSDEMWRRFEWDGPARRVAALIRRVAQDQA